MNLIQLMKSFKRFVSSVTCESVCFQNLLTTSIISSTKVCYTKSYFLLLFLRTTLPSNIFLLPIRLPRFLFCLYVVIGSCSNAVVSFEFICNKFNLFWSFSFDFGASNAFFQFLIVVEILHNFFWWNPDL